MVQDNPIQVELEQLAYFCKKYRHVFLWGHDQTQKYIAKYLRMASIPIVGYVMDQVSAADRCEEELDVVDISELKKAYKNMNTGIIISSPADQMNRDTALLRDSGFQHLFLVSDWNRRTIAYKMTPRSKENFWIEVNLADHCNLNCQCCDHFSPIATPTWLDFDQYVKDLKRLSNLTNNKIGLIKLQGGEPLLNDRLIDYIRVTREIFPNAFICLFTAGLLLKKWGKQPEENNLWRAVKDYEIEVRWTHYPINMRFDEIRKEAESYGIEWWEDPPPFEKGARVWFFSEIGALEYKGIKHSVKHPFWLNGGVAPYRWISCYQFNESIVLRDGKIYTCPMIPYVHFFNSYFHQDLKVTEEDYIDIYAANSYEEIAEFCTHRTPFCGYCAVHHRFSQPWKQSTHKIDEWSEPSSVLGDSLNPFVQKLDKGCTLMSIGIQSLKEKGVKVTFKKTVNVLKQSHNKNS